MFVQSTSSGQNIMHALGPILVVEDEAALREIVAEFLQDEGFEIVSAPNGDSALELVRENKNICLIFTDIRMPGTLDGIAMAKEARKIRPDIPVVVASGFSERIHGCIKSTDFPFLQKPYSLGDLTEQINLSLHL